MTAIRMLLPLALDGPDVTDFPALDALEPATMTLSGNWDDGSPTVVTRAAPIVLHLPPGKAFRARSLTVTRFEDGTAWTEVHLTPNDRRRLHRYLHPDVHARRSAMHSAYHRRRR